MMHIYVPHSRRLSGSTFRCPRCCYRHISLSPNIWSITIIVIIVEMADFAQRNIICPVIKTIFRMNMSPLLCRSFSTLFCAKSTNMLTSAAANFSQSLMQGRFSKFTIRCSRLMSTTLAVRRACYRFDDVLMTLASWFTQIFSMPTTLAVR